MNDYSVLGEYLETSNEEPLVLSYEQINEILGFQVISEKRASIIFEAHADLMKYSYRVEEVDLLNKTVTFSKLNAEDSFILEKIKNVFKSNSFIVTYEDQKDGYGVKPYINVSVRKNDIELHVSLMGNTGVISYHSIVVKKMKEEVKQIADKHNSEFYNVYSSGLKGRGYMVLVSRRFEVTDFADLEEILQDNIIGMECSGMYSAIDSVIKDMNNLELM